MVDARIAQRRQELREQRRRRRLRRTLVVASLLVGAGGLLALDRSGWVDVEQVDVVGAQRATDAQILEAAEISAEETILRVRTSKIADQVAALPIIATADARRTGIHTLEITVVERQPVVQATGRGSTVLIDREGVIIERAELDGLSVIRLPRTPPEVGQTVQANAALANAFEAWRGLSGPLRADVAALEAPSVDELKIVFRRGTDVLFGRAERMDEKVRAIGSVIADLGDIDVDYIDVRAPSAPVIVTS